MGKSMEGVKVSMDKVMIVNKAKNIFKDYLRKKKIWKGV
jgi:hypothetical protein